MQSKKNKTPRIVFIIPQQHFDPIWRKPFGEYVEKQEDFLLKAFRIMKRYPEFSFNEGQAVVLQRFIGAHPHLKRFIKERIKKGRFEVVCGMEVIPDVNIPSGESLIRQALSGKSWARKVFKVDVETAWLYDTFGLSAQMPQILMKCGFKWLHAIRFGNRKDVQLPCYWEGIDGTRILMHSRDYNHNSWQWFDIDKTLKDIKNLKNINKFIVDRSLPLENYPPYYLEKNKADYLWYEPHSEEETPSCHIVEKSKEWNKKQNEFKFIFALPREYFKAIARTKENMPLIKGDLNPEFTGVYSSRIWLKLLNREVEAKLLTAEKLTVIAGMFGYNYPEEKLNEAWKELLFTHHHDGICGCHIDMIDELLTHKFNYAKKIADKIIETSFRHLASKINTVNDEHYNLPLIIFNPLGWNRSDFVEMQLPLKKGANIKSLALKDADNNTIPIEVLNNAERNVQIAFVAEHIPSLGYEVYYLTKEGQKISDTKLMSSENVIENDLYKITACDKGIVSIKHKDGDKELLDTNVGFGNEIILEEDKGDLYVGNYTGSKIKASQGELKLKRVEHNSVFASVFFKGRFSKIPWLDKGALAWQQETRIYNSLKRIDFITKINWRGENTRISVRFPTRIKSSGAYYEIPFGAVKRKPYNFSSLARDGDYPAQNWVSISKKDFGVTLCNTGTGGIRVKNGLIEMTLLRTGLRGRYGGIFGGYSLEKAKGNGEHIFKYSLIFHKGDWKENSVFKDGLEINNPLIAKAANQHKGDLPPQKSFFGINSQNLVLSCLKMSKIEKGSIVLRIYEATGKQTRAELFFSGENNEIKEVNLIEDCISMGLV